MDAVKFALDNKALSLAERGEFSRIAARRAQTERSHAVRGLFRASANRFRRPRPLLRALVSAAAVLVAVISIGAILLSAPVSARVGIVSIGYMSAR